ncbi:hypothetical protein Fmac_028993 [Flemingia macrophylla]|uniref:Uncharacterized protein n=1 Tax=Flemingia macrophylla TaxID=520843 RepID=A0ABD1L939_9FABA
MDLRVWKRKYLKGKRVESEVVWIKGKIVESEGKVYETPSLADFEALLLAFYAAETKSRNGKPIVVTIPDLNHPSIYHAPLHKPQSQSQSSPSLGLISPPLEPQPAVKSTKRPTIVGVALHSFFSQISHMPAWSKLHFCQFAAVWAGADCPCRNDLDQTLDFDNLIPQAQAQRIPLPWEILQPSLRILSHCLLGPLNPTSPDVKDATSVAVRCLYARASHDGVAEYVDVDCLCRLQSDMPRTVRYDFDAGEPPGEQRVPQEEGPVDGAILAMQGEQDEGSEGHDHEGAGGGSLAKKATYMEITRALLPFLIAYMTFSSNLW